MKEDTLQRFAALSLVLMPIFACYNIFGTCVAKYMMLISCFVFWIWSKKKAVVPRKLLSFLIYSFTIPQLIAIFTGNTSQFIGSFISLGLFVVNLCLLIPHLKTDTVMKYYRILVYFTIVVFILQELSALFLGHRFSALIPFMDLYTDIPARQYAYALIDAPRSSSIFVEPSHYAQYLAPFLAMSLLECDNKERFASFEAVLVSTVFLIMRSGNGLILCFAIWVIHIIFANTRLLKKLFIVIPISIILGLQVFSVFSNTEKGAEVLNRSTELDADQERTSSSGSIRIFRGFLVQKEMPLSIKVFGVGQGGANDIIDHSSVSWMFFKEHYLNNASGFLISYGYIGTFLFLAFLFSLYDKRKKGVLMLIVAFLTLCFIESFMCDSRMLLYIALICMIKYSSDSIERTISAQNVE